MLVMLSTVLLISCDKTDNLCSDEYGFIAGNFVNLPDYSNFKIQASDYIVTEEDIDRYIYFELISKNLYDNETINAALQSGRIRQCLSNQIAKEYYAKSSSDELIESIKHNLQRDRIWDEFYENIIEHAYANHFPKQKDEYIDFKIHALNLTAEENNMKPEEYLKNDYNLTLSEYRESLTYEFLEIIVIKSIADQEEISCGINDYSKKIKEISIDEGIDEKTVEKLYSKYDIYNEIYLDLIKEHMFSKYTCFGKTDKKSAF